MKWTIGLAGLVAGSSIFALASCADSSEDSSNDVLDGSVIPSAEASVDAADDACADGGDACAAPKDPCEGASFCPMMTGIDPRRALMGIWGTGPTDVWAVGTNGTILHWDGTAWVLTPSDTNQALFAVTGRSATDVWAVSSRAVVLHSNGFAGGTATWTAAPPVADTFKDPNSTVWNEALLLSARTTAQGDVWLGGEPYPVVVDDGGHAMSMSLWRRGETDGTTTWNFATIATNAVTVRGLWSDPGGDVWAVGGMAPNAAKPAGRTFHATGTNGPRGPVWTEYDSRSSSTLNAVWASGAGDVWAVGDRGTLRHWKSADQTRWDIVESPTDEDLEAIWGSASNDVWAVGGNGTILHFDGTTWALAPGAFPHGLKPHLHGIWGSSPSDVWIVGDGVVLHRVTNVVEAP
ncbi:hypothetical protein [Labilithrix luteola]|nr:hypothetical protein [Labilithrix luteola]